MGRRNRFGVLPPSELRWTTGKTVASIQFVQDAERYLTTATNRQEKALLREVIQKIKNGQVALIELLTPEKFLRQPNKYLKPQYSGDALKVIQSLERRLSRALKRAREAERGERTARLRAESAEVNERQLRNLLARKTDYASWPVPSSPRNQD